MVLRITLPGDSAFDVCSLTRFQAWREVCSMAHRNKPAQEWPSQSQTPSCSVPWAKNLNLNCKTLPAQIFHVRNTQGGSLTHDLISGQLKMSWPQLWSEKRMCSLLHSPKVINNRQLNYGIQFPHSFTKDLSVYLYLILLRSFFFSLSQFFPRWYPLPCPHWNSKIVYVDETREIAACVGVNRSVTSDSLQPHAL